MNNQYLTALLNESASMMNTISEGHNSGIYIFTKISKFSRKTFELFLNNDLIRDEL